MELEAGTDVVGPMLLGRAESKDVPSNTWYCIVHFIPGLVGRSTSKQTPIEWLTTSDVCEESPWTPGCSLLFKKRCSRANLLKASYSAGSLA